MAHLGNNRHFYLTLPSNSSHDFYGNQEPHSFKTKLEHAISLDPEQWEVGLAEIVYPRSWYNVSKGVYRLTYPITDGEVRIEDFPDTTSSLGELPGARYLSAHHLVRDLNASVKENLPDKAKERFRIRYDPVSNRVKIYLQHYCTIFLPHHIGVVLGLSGRMAERVRDSYGRMGYTLPHQFAPLSSDKAGTMSVGNYSVDVNRLLPTVYIYCDLVQQQYVGDSYVQLLRTVSVPEGGGDTITHKFNNIHYVNLQTGNFESIEIKLTDGRGDPVEFKHGDVIVKLHFRRKKQ